MSSTSTAADRSRSQPWRPPAGGPWGEHWGPPWRRPWAGRNGRPPLPFLIFPMVLLAVFQVVGTYFASDNQPDSTQLDVLGYTLLVAGPAVLTMRYRYPVQVLVAVAGIVLGYLAIGYPYGPIFLSFVVAVFRAVMSGHRRAAWITVGVAFAGYTVLSYTIAPEPGSPVVHVALVLAWMLVVIGVAELVRIQRERFAEIARSRSEEARRRTSEERLGFARELHDVLAHNISLINVQAGVALHLIDSQPEQARVALAAIKEASKETLRELRATLGVLRQVDEDAPRAPSPSLARLDELISRVAAAGLTVGTMTEGTAVPLPAHVDLAAYRIVQEALTNVYRHSGASTAVVLLRYSGDELVVQVDDNGNGSPTTPSSTGGAGIRGMRERAESLGGDLMAGPRPEGGFRVTARLPLREQP